MKEVAPKNISSIVVTWDTLDTSQSSLDTSQSLSGWLKDLASENIKFIISTLDTFHLLSGWLKEENLKIRNFRIVILSTDH